MEKSFNSMTLPDLPLDPSLQMYFEKESFVQIHKILRFQFPKTPNTVWLDTFKGMCIASKWKRISVTAANITF